MMKEVGMRPADLGGNGFQGHGLGAVPQQQFAGGRQSGGPAFLGAQSFADY